MAGVQELEKNLTAGLPGTKFLADDPNVVTPGQKLNAAVGQFFKNLGATVGPVASDFGRGVSQVAGIPKTIYEGTQTPAPTAPVVGGAEPTVNPALLNLVRGVAEPTIKTNATPKAPSVTTPAPATPGVIDISRPTEGSRETLNLLRNAPPLGASGSQFGSFGSDQEYADWKARGEKINSAGVMDNPNDSRTSELSDILASAVKTMMGEGNLLKRKYDIMAVKAIKDALTGISPMSSFGQFGVEGRKADIAKGHLGVAEGELGVKKSTLELAKTKEAREGVETAAKSKYYEANAEESKAKAKYYGDQDKPGKFETQAQQAWLKGYDDYLKSDTVLQDILGKEDPAERAAAIESHKALYRQLNPPVPIRKVDNPDGTITVTFADGTVQKMRKKGAK